MGAFVKPDDWTAENPDIAVFARRGRGAFEWVEVHRLGVDSFHHFRKGEPLFAELKRLAAVRGDDWMDFISRDFAERAC